MTQENRRHDRQSVSLAGTLKSEADASFKRACRIEDLSVGGARIALIGADTRMPERPLLEISTFGAYPVEVAWTKPPRFGLKFRDEPETMAEVLAGIAMHG
jgi:hypothetical protein